MEKYIPSLACCKYIFPHSFKDEVKSIIKFAWPLIISNFSEFVIPIISLLFLGHYGETHLAASGLALSFCNLCGVALIVGLDTATQTLCSQAYGAKNHRLFGIIAQRALIIQLIVIIGIVPLWINSEKILLGLGQDRYVSRLAGQFILWRIPSYVLQGVYRTMASYLICQEISLPLVIIGSVGVMVSAIFHALLVYYAKLGVIGSGLAIDFSYLILCIIVYAYICMKKIFDTWPGWSMECLHDWKQFMLLALPGSLMILFDWGTAEVGIFLIGLLGKVELGTQSVIFNIIATLFMVPLSVSIVATVKVGHYLGSGEPKKAINISKSCLILFWIVGLFDGIVLTCAKDYIGRVFSNSVEVIKLVSKLAPMTAAFHILDGTQGVFAGILRGLGLQKYGAISNFIGFDIIGLPLGSVFGLVLKMSVLGFWAGISIGMAVQAILMSLCLVCSNWEKLSRKAREGVSGTEFKELPNCHNDDDDTQELVLQEAGVCHDNVDDSVYNNSADEGLDEISSSHEGVPTNDIAVTYAHVRFSRYVCLRSMIVLLLSMTSLTIGILIRCLL